jgi:hypothetical protein
MKVSNVWFGIDVEDWRCDETMVMMGGGRRLSRGKQLFS